MTKKHFKELAKIAALISDPLERKIVAESLANLCARSNPRFSRSKFLDAVAKEV